MTLIEILSSVIITIIPLGQTLPNTEDICGGEVGGVYTEGKIYLCEKQDESFEFYKQHEIAHHIWAEFLTGKQRDEYAKIYKKHRKVGLRAFGREYSYSDVEEDFADNYASWRTKERVNIYTKKRIKIILKFITL